MTMVRSKDKELTAKSLTMSIFKLLDLIGCNPNTQTPLKHLISILHLLGSTLVIILVALNTVLKYNNNNSTSTVHQQQRSVSSFTEDNIMMFGFIQVVAKCTMGYVKGNTIYSMLVMVWDLVDFDDCDIKVKRIVLKHYEWIELGRRFYRNTIIIGITIFILGTSLRGNLVMDIWLPHKEFILRTPPYRQIVLLIQILLFESVCYFFLIPVDTLFMVVNGIVYTQFKVLKWNLSRIGTGTGDDDYFLIIKCIQHHNTLLRLLKKVENSYSELFLPAILSSFLLLTLTMYAMVMDESTSQKITYLLLTVIVMIQIFCYCIVGSLVQDQAASVAQSAYNSNWINVHDYRVRMALVLIIMRAQRPVKLTIGRLITMNLQSFTSVVRVSFSFMTFIINMRSTK